MKTKRNHFRVKSFLLRNGPATTPEIRRHINKTTRDGILINALNILLHHDPDIENIGMDKVIGYHATIKWKLIESDPAKWVHVPVSRRKT